MFSQNQMNWNLFEQSLKKILTSTRRLHQKLSETKICLIIEYLIQHFNFKLIKELNQSSRKTFITSEILLQKESVLSRTEILWTLP